MSAKEEVLKIGKKLEKLIADNAADHSSVCDLLKTLKKTNITLDVLQKTRIGITVNNLRKAAKDEDAINLSKSLIKSWKKLVPDSGGHGDGPARRCSSTSARSASTTSASSEVEESGRRSSVMSEEGESSQKSSSSANRRESVSSESSSANRRESTESNEALQRSMSSQEEGNGERDESGSQISPPREVPPVEVDETKDPVRLKCREMLIAALKAPPTLDEVTLDCDRLGAEIEQFVYKQFDNTEMKYKNRIRSRITNLKDAKNPRLRENILLGHISAKKFSMMTPDEMASDEMKKLREKLSQEAFNDHQMATNSGTKSDLFKCGRCGKRNTTYNQLQTRSSDEPMTTFVLCNECGNRWKFC